METMLKQEIIEKISQFFRMSHFEAEKIFNDIFSKIMTGIKEDNLIDVANFGEFIIKQNYDKMEEESHTSYKNTIEFVPSVELEDGIGHKSYNFLQHNVSTVISDADKKTEIPKTPSVIPEEPKTENEKRNVESEKIPFIPYIKQVTEEKPKTFEKLPPIEPVFPPPSVKKPEITSEIPKTTEQTQSPLNPEEEFKRKREELLSNVSTRPLQDAETVKKPDISVHKYFFSKSEPQNVNETKNVLESKEKIGESALDKQVSENIGEKEEEKIAETSAPSSDSEVKTAPTDEDLSKKSFSDYFTEINKKDEIKEEPVVETMQPPPQVIPREAVELHKEITRPVPPPADTFPPIAPKKVEQTILQKGDDRTYLLYKDAEPAANVSQMMSKEYGYPYYSVKKEKGKSKLKFYFFSVSLLLFVVVILLIFSQKIYRFLLVPFEPQNTENIEKQNSSDQRTENIEKQNPAEQKTEQTQPSTDIKIEGVEKNSVGWTDAKFKVMYIKLDDGKFTIQESSWDSEAKAKKRISEIEGLNIKDVKGNVVKNDMGDKGIWFRVRFGEFNSLEEARAVAEVIRKR